MRHPHQAPLVRHHQHHRSRRWKRFFRGYSEFSSYGCSRVELSCAAARIVSKANNQGRSGGVECGKRTVVSRKLELALSTATTSSSSCFLARFIGAIFRPYSLELRYSRDSIVGLVVETSVVVGGTARRVETRDC